MSWGKVASQSNKNTKQQWNTNIAVTLRPTFSRSDFHNKKHSPRIWDAAGGQSEVHGAKLTERNTVHKTFSKDCNTSLSSCCFGAVKGSENKRLSKGSEEAEARSTDSKKVHQEEKHRKGPSTYLSGFSPLSELKNEFNLWLWSKLFLSFLWLFLSVHFSQEAIIKLGFITNWKAGKDRPLKNESSKTHHS